MALFGTLGAAAQSTGARRTAGTRDPQIEINGLLRQYGADFTIGTAEVLGEFRLQPDAVVLELASIDGGGEGVLLSLTSLARRYARSRGLSRIEWIGHAVVCAKQNLKLRRVLDRRGFVVERVGASLVYHRIEEIVPPEPR
jgi:hypothetical protein